jgi:imidazolonepropionase-like amidohydrolase
MVKYDAHIHIALDGADYKEMKRLHQDGPNEGHIRALLSAYKEAGFTSLRDGGDKWGCSLLAKSLAPEYDIDYRSPGFAIYKKGSYGSILGRSFSDINEFKELLEEVKKNNCDFVKIMGSGIMDFNEYGVISEFTILPDEMKDMIKMSHDAGFAVMVHCNGNEKIVNWLEAGADSIEHGYYMDEDTLDLIKEKGAFWTPTVIPVAALAGQPGFNEEVIKRILQKHMENIHKAAKLGINLLSGSDAGSFMVPHVKGSLKELALISDILKEEFE